VGKAFTLSARELQSGKRIIEFTSAQTKSGFLPLFEEQRRSLPIIENLEKELSY
jgi:hypothetical protein